jgi:hypothetical protein
MRPTVKQILTFAGDLIACLALFLALFVALSFGV